MIRSPLRLLAALALVALTLFVVACGGDDNESRRQRREDAATAPPTEGKKGGKLEQLGASDVDFLDPGQTYYTGGFQVLYADPDARSTLQARTRTRPVPDLADGEPQISDDKKTVTVKLKKGVKFGPPVNREIQAKDVKYAFERCVHRRTSPNQYTTYFNFIEGCAEEAGRASRTSPASVVRTTRPDHVQAHARRRASGLRRVPDHAGHHAGPEGVRGEVRQGEPVDVQRARRLLRPVHGRERRPGQARRLQGRQVDPPRPQPELGQGPGLPSRVPRRDHADARTRPTPTSPAARCSRARTWSSTRTRRRRCSSGSCSARRTSSSRSRAVASAGSRSTRRSSRSTTSTSARRSSRRSTATAAIKARGGTFVGKPGTHFLPPGIPGFEEAGGEKGPGLRLPGQPEGRHGRGREVHEGGRLLVRQVRRQRRAPDGRRERRPGQGPGRGRARRSSRSSASRSVSARCRRTRSTPSGASSRPRRSPSAAPRVGSRTSTTRSRCSSRRSRARTISPDGGNNNLAAAQGPEDRQGHGRRRRASRATSATRPGARSTR